MGHGWPIYLPCREQANEKFVPESGHLTSVPIVIHIPNTRSAFVEAKSPRRRRTKPMTDQILEKIGAAGLLPVITIEDAGRAADLGAALVAGGLPLAEITFRTPAAAKAIRAMRDANPDMLIGAGTVLTVDQARAAMDAGATFLVAPGLNPAMVEWCQNNDILMIPGVATPSDIERGLSLGVKHMKFFPAEAFGGLTTLKAISAPYGDVRFIPTGGIGPHNYTDYLKFDRIHACGGSWMVPTDAISSGDWKRIETLTREAVDLRKSVRG
jgi:2-dehydro-3-deoxyphosphogluconate aldolase/(4S)-4-hydroxy-2-oxoglutarate aldolase